MSPNPKSATEPLTIHYDTRLTLKLEGVIEVKAQGSKVKELRQVKQVKVQVKSTQQSRGHMISETKVGEVIIGHMISEIKVGEVMYYETYSRSQVKILCTRRPKVFMLSRIK